MSNEQFHSQPPQSAVIFASNTGVAAKTYQAETETGDKYEIGAIKSNTHLEEVLR